MEGRQRNGQCTMGWDGRFCKEREIRRKAKTKISGDLVRKGKKWHKEDWRGRNNRKERWPRKIDSTREENKNRKRKARINGDISRKRNEWYKMDGRERKMENKDGGGR